MSYAAKFPATRAVLELVNTVISEADAKQIALANGNDPEAVALIERAVDKVERAEATRLIRMPPVLPQWGERPLTENERNAIDALITYQAEQTPLTAYAIDKLVCSFFGVEMIRDLKAWEYDAVIRFLADFKAGNV